MKGNDQCLLMTALTAAEMTVSLSEKGSRMGAALMAMRDMGKGGRNHSSINATLQKILLYSDLIS